MIRSSRGLKSALRTSTAVLGLAAALVLPSYAIVGNDNYTPTQLVDTTNITGIGQMVIDNGGGSVGLCTASLINPRTVIFAAHCVNENKTGFVPASAYGVANGGKPISFMFNAENLDPILNWLFGPEAGGPAHQTRPGEYAYNSNYVIYNPQSIQLGFGNNFFEGDIAMAALDTPATNIPTWSLLFSPLTGPTHATITGYGRNGTGTDGDYGDIDFRRRSAENIISVLGSLDDVDGFLFHSPDGLPQNLYQLDFNDPKFGTAEANQFDFNIFNDKALSKEGITAGGDSGGPLIVDQLFSKPVIAAVLSGGSTFFRSYGQASASYGTTSFYQPLYLYWDWIVANNPYKYVAAKAGDGSWTDPSHWEFTLDPNYLTVDADGNLVNALPTTPAQHVPAEGDVNTPKYGQICDGASCYDIGTGQPVDYATGNAPTGADVVISSSPATVQITDTAGTSSRSASPAVVDLARTLIVTAEKLGLNPNVIGNGIPASEAPGSSNFVPRNSDGDATHAPRYYDVTLAANGTTTLANASVVIDRLTINGAKTGLNIASTGGLGVNIDVTMYAGILNVDGVLVTNGDLALMGGLLTGSGIVLAPYTTAVLGGIAPGQLGAAGTLTLYSNVVLSSHSGLLIDLGAAKSDRLDVYGTLSLGGTLVLSPLDGYKPKWRESKLIATADTISGKFDSIRDNIPGVLYPVVATVAANGYDTEIVTFQAASFQTVLTNANGDQLAVGSVLDTNRAGSYTALQTIYDAIDTLGGSDLSNALTALAPNAARSVPQSAQLLTNAHTGLLLQYMGSTDPLSEPKLAVQTGSLKLAANSQTGSFEMRNMLASLGAEGDCTTGRIVCATDASSGGSDSSSGGMVLPKGVGAFLTGQKIDGNLKLGGGSGKADLDGYMIALGADVGVYEGLRTGLSFGFGEADTTLRDQPARTKTTSREVIAYGMYISEGGYFANGFVGIGWQSFHSLRQVTFGGTTEMLDGRSSATSPLVAFQVGKAVSDVLGGTMKPAIGLQYGQINMDGYTETGGVAALSIHSYNQPSVNARVGFDTDWSVDLSGIVLKPQVHAFLVNRLSERSGQMTAGFAVAPDAVASYEVAGDSKTWADLGLKLDAEVYDNTALGFTFNANPGNAGGTYTAFGGSLRVKF